MDTQARPSRYMNASRDLTSSNTLSSQANGNSKVRSWGSSQQAQSQTQQAQSQTQYTQSQTQQPSNQQQRSNGAKLRTVHLPNYDRQSKDALLEEIAKQKRQNDILEASTYETEQKYIAYSTLTETTSQKQLREYKLHAKQKIAAYDKEVRRLHELATSQEQKSIDITKNLEATATELFKVKAATSTQAGHETEISNLMLDTKEYKISSKLKEEEARALRHQILQYQNYLQANTESIVDRISYLKSNLQFDEAMTGLTIIGRETTNELDIVHCKQIGKLGNIEYRLEFFTDSDNVKQVNFIPISNNINDQRLATSMNDELQFAELDAPVFFWRMVTYLNKPPRDTTR